MAQKLKVFFGSDPKGTTTGFYWPGSEQKRAEVNAVRSGAPDAFEAIYQARPGARIGSIFLEEDFNYYIPPQKLEQGVLINDVKKFVAQGHAVIQAWDTAYEETKDSAWTVCVTALMVPCSRWHRGEDPLIMGTCDHHFDVFVLDVYREKIGLGDLIMKIRSHAKLWNPEAIIIEKKASGISAIQSLLKSDLPIRPVGAEISKRARAINGIGAGSAQGCFKRHRVYFPTTSPWVPALKAEMKDFSGAEDNISDQVDAIVHLLRYVILQGGSAAMFPTNWTPEKGTQIEVELAQQVLESADSDRGMLLTSLGELEDNSYDPFIGLCGRCTHFGKTGYCSIHRQNRASVDSCEFYADDVNGSPLRG